MKILFASDVHGSLYDAEKLLERIVEEKPNYVMLLGDFCGYAENLIFGEVFGKIPCPYSYLRGNCDRADVLKAHGFSDEAYTAVEKFGDRKVFATHGHIYFPGKFPPCMEKGDIFVSGHTHVPTIFYLDGINVVNCGSMSRPRGSSVKTYAVIDGNFAYIKDENGETVEKTELK